MSLGLVTVLRTDNVLVTSCFTVTLICRPWSTKIEQIGIFASHKPYKNETKSRIPPSTWSQTTRTWSLLHSVHNHAPLRYGLKIEQINILEVPQGKLRNIPKKSSKLTIWGPGSVETNSLVLYEHQLRTKSKDHQWRHRQKSADNIFFGKRWKPRICPAEFFDFKSRYLENENEFFKNSFETVFRASKSRDGGQLVSAFQLRLTKPCYSYAELAETGIEPGTSWFADECSTDWATRPLIWNSNKVFWKSPFIGSFT